jgi:hypothetical protein
MYVCDEEDEQMLSGDNMRQQDTIYDGRQQPKQIAQRWIGHHMAFARHLQDHPFQFFDQCPQDTPDQFCNFDPPFVSGGSITSITIDCKKRS